MENPYYEYINRKNNTYSSYIRKAKAIYNIQGKHTEAECKYLQAAAEIKADIIRYVTVKGSSGEYRKTHEKDLELLNAEIQKIYMEINPRKYKQIKDTPKDIDESKNNTVETDDEAINTSSWYKQAPEHSFEDVSGMEKLKEKLRTCVTDANFEELSEYLKIKPLNSFFFVGPPGCGKTYIIEAFIHELMGQDFNYISLNGSDIISKYVGDAEKIVDTLFNEAINSAPCVVFLDEIDGVCKNRSLQALPEYAASITTSFLTGYNKINNSKKKIIFIGATNYPKKVDTAMLDRVEVITVDLPDFEARTYAFKQHFSNIIETETDCTYEYMAECTDGYNYRDIDRLVEIIKHSIFKELSRKMSAHECIMTMKSGSFRLGKKRFNAALKSFTPSNKDDIIKDIQEWLGKIQGSDKSIDDMDEDLFFDIDDVGNEIVSEDTESTSDFGVDGVGVNRFVNIDYEDTQDSTALARTNLHGLSVDSIQGFVNVEFEIKGKNSDKVLAEIDGYNFICKKDGKNYVFNFMPDKDKQNYTVRVSDEDGFVDEFYIDIGKPMSSNEEFDL